MQPTPHMSAFEDTRCKSITSGDMYSIVLKGEQIINSIKLQTTYIQELMLQLYIDKNFIHYPQSFPILIEGDSPNSIANP